MVACNETSIFETTGSFPLTYQKFFALDRVPLRHPEPVTREGFLSPTPLKCAKIKCAQIRNTVATIELRLILAKFRANLDQKILKFSSKSDQL